MLGLPSGGSGGLAVVPVEEEQGEGAHHQEEEHPHAEAGVVLDGLGGGEGLLHGAWPPRVLRAPARPYQRVGVKSVGGRGGWLSLAGRSSCGDLPPIPQERWLDATPGLKPHRQAQSTSPLLGWSFPAVRWQGWPQYGPASTCSEDRGCGSNRPLQPGCRELASPLLWATLRPRGPLRRMVGTGRSTHLPDVFVALLDVLGGSHYQLVDAVNLGFLRRKGWQINTPAAPALSVSQQEQKPPLPGGQGSTRVNPGSHSTPRDRRLPFTKGRRTLCPRHAAPRWWGCDGGGAGLPPLPPFPPTPQR